MHRWVLLLLLVFSSGCPSLREYNSLDFLPSENEMSHFSAISGKENSVEIKELLNEIKKII